MVEEFCFRPPAIMILLGGLSLLVTATAAVHPLVQDLEMGTMKTYETVSGFFVQDELPVGLPTPPAIPPRFGLIDGSETRWKDLFDRIAELNEGERLMSGGGGGWNSTRTSYKVVFLGRHGEGYHNVAEAKYGTQAWDDYWSHLNGDGNITWGPDAELTGLGKSQAVTAHEAWKTELQYHLPVPGRLYISPLTRALQTYDITFGAGIMIPPDKRPLVLENCREQSGIHTCDKRRTRTYIETRFESINVEIEKEFTEEDLFWDPDVRETMEHVVQRAKLVLSVMFEHDEPFISVTAHSGFINGFLMAVGRPTYPLPTGGVLPVVVKATFSGLN